MPDTDVLIVGAGPAGLTTAGALKHLGIDSVLLDSGSRVGQSWERRYDRLHLHTARGFSGLAHYPIPRTDSNYLSKDQYAAYLREYAAHFRLSLVPNTTVTRVRQSADGARWQVETVSAAAPSGPWTARRVVVATGQFAQPYTPSLPGLAGYGGQALHSVDYRSGRVFAGQRVLVIGAGNSGLEIAVDLVEQGAAGVAVSLRSAPPVVPRDLLGLPIQVWGILLVRLPPALADRLGSALARLALGDLRRSGLPAAAWQPFSSRRTPVIDVGFAPALKAGQLALRPAVTAFSPSGVVFADGRAEPFDAVILATGFRSGLEQILEPPGLLDQYGSPLAPSGSPTTCQGLYFMGFFETLRGFLYESNLASRRLARHIKRQKHP